VARYVADSSVYYVVLGLVLPLLTPITLLNATTDANSQAPRITAIVKQARVSVKGAEPRTISVGDSVSEHNEIVTGADSRIELSFGLDAVARLGANAALTVKSKDVIELSRGTLLLHFPGGIKAKVEAGPVSVVVGRATAVLEYDHSVFKLLVLEGTARLYRPAKLGDSVLVHSGEMVFGNATAPLTDPVNFDIGRFVDTCPLIHDFSPLPNERLLRAASELQQRAKSKRQLIETNLVIFRGSSMVSIVNPANVSAAPTPEATPTTVSNRIPLEPSQEVRP
jgi:hypothetical protein